MPLNKTARIAIVAISVAFLAAVAGLIASAHSYTGTENSTSSLESQIDADRHRDLTVSAYYPADFYGEGWVPIGAVCPGATEPELLEAGLTEDFVERFNLNGEGVAEDANYLVLANLDQTGNVTEFEIDQMDIEHINLCYVTQQYSGQLSGYGNIVPLSNDILVFNHQDGVSYLMP